MTMVFGFGIHKCPKCGSIQHWGIWQIEMICSQCGHRYPSIRTLTAIVIFMSIFLLFMLPYVLINHQYGCQSVVLVALPSFIVVLGLLQIAILRKRRKVIPSEPEREARMELGDSSKEIWFCRHCGNLDLREADFCPECGEAPGRQS
jgi:hypothetical protein